MKRLHFDLHEVRRLRGVRESAGLFISCAVLPVPMTLMAQESLVVPPTEAMNVIWPQVLVQPFDSQVVIVERWLPHLNIDTTRMPDDRQARLSLGEAMFLAFAPDEANYYFESVADGGDLVAQHAWDRIMQIRFRAFQDAAGMRELFDVFYDRFPPTVLNTRGRYQQVSNLAREALADSNPGGAVDLVVRELRRLPGNAPYRSFGLLEDPVLRDVIMSSRRAPEIARLVENLLIELRGTQVRWSRADPSAATDPQFDVGVPEWYWRAQGILRGETFHQARSRQLRDVIGRLDWWLARHSMS